MRRVELDATLGSVEAIYDRLAGTLGFPAHFGRNLDALYDTLTADIAGPVEIVWRDHVASQRRLGIIYEELLRVLYDVARERPDFRLTLT